MNKKSVKERQKANRIVTRPWVAPVFDLVEDSFKWRSLAVLLMFLIFCAVFTLVIGPVLKDPVLNYGTNEVQQITVLSVPFSASGFLDEPIPVDAIGGPSTQYLLGRALNSQGLGVRQKILQIKAELTVMDRSGCQIAGQRYYMPGMAGPLTEFTNPCSTSAGVSGSDQARFAQACQIVTSPSSVQTDDFGIFQLNSLTVSTGFPGTFAISFSVDGVVVEAFRIYLSGRTCYISFSYGPSLTINDSVASIPLAVGKQFDHSIYACAGDTANRHLPGTSMYLYSYSPTPFARNIDDALNSEINIQGTPEDFYTFQDLGKLLRSGLQQRRLSLIQAPILQTGSDGCVDLSPHLRVLGFDYSLQYIGVLSHGQASALFDDVPVLMSPAPGTVAISSVSILDPSLSRAVQEGDAFGSNFLKVQISPPSAGRYCFISIAEIDGAAIQYDQTFYNPAVYNGRQLQNIYAQTDVNGVADFASSSFDTAGDAFNFVVKASCEGVASSNTVGINVWSRVTAAILLTDRSMAQYNNNTIEVCLRHFDVRNAISVVFLDSNDMIVSSKNAMFRLVTYFPAPSVWGGNTSDAVLTAYPSGSSPGDYVLFIHAAIRGALYELLASVDGGASWMEVDGYSYAAVDCTFIDFDLTFENDLRNAGYFSQDVSLCDPSTYPAEGRVPSFVGPVLSQWPDEFVLGERSGGDFSVFFLDQCANPFDVASQGIPEYFNATLPFLVQTSFAGQSAVFWMPGYGPTGSSSFYSSLQGLVTVQPPIVGPLSSPAFVPEWFQTSPAAAKFPMFVTPVLTSKYAYQDSDLKNIDLYVSYSVSPAYRFIPAMPRYVRLTPSVSSITVVPNSMSPPGESISAVYQIFPPRSGVLVSLQVFSPPSIAAQSSCSYGLFTNSFIPGTTLQNPLVCLDSNLLYPTIQGVTNASGLVELGPFFCGNYPGAYYLAVSSSGGALSSYHFDCSPTFSTEVTMTSAPADVFGVPIDPSGLLVGQKISWNVSVTQNNVVVQRPTFLKVLSPVPAFNIIPMTFSSSSSPIFFGYNVPCVGNTCSFHAAYVPASLSYTMATSFVGPIPSVAAWNKPFSPHLWADIFLCSYANGKNYTALRNGELILSTVQGYLLKNAVNVCIRPRVTLNQDMLLYIDTVVTNPSSSPAHVASSFEKLCFVPFVVAGDIQMCTLSLRFDNAAPMRYSVQHTVFNVSTVSFYVDVFHDVQSFSFLQGFDPFTAVSVGDLFPLSIQVFSAQKLPVPLRRVSLKLFLTGTSVPSPNSTLRAYSVDFRSLTDTGNAVIPEDSSSNFTALPPWKPSATVPMPESFGVAYFNSLQITAGMTGVYVFGVFVDSYLIGTSPPFVLRNPVSKVTLSLSSFTALVPGHNSLGVYVVGLDSNGVPVAYQSVSFVVRRTSCTEFTNICLVSPTLSASGMVSGALPTGADGSVAVSSLYFSGGSNGRYDIIARVKGVDSNPVTITINNIASVSVDQLGSYRFFIAGAALCILPALFSIRTSARWPVVLGGLVSFILLIIVESLALFHDILFVPSQDYEQTSYFAMTLAALAFGSSVLVIVLLLIVLLLIRIIHDKNSPLMSFDQQKRSMVRLYVRKLFLGSTRVRLANSELPIDEMLSTYADLLSYSEIMIATPRKSHPEQSKKDDVELPLVLAASGNVALFEEESPPPERDFRDLKLQHFLRERKLPLYSKLGLFCRRVPQKGLKISGRQLWYSVKSLPENHSYLETSADFFYPTRLVMTVCLAFLFLTVATFAAVIILLWIRYLLTVAFSYFLEKFYAANLAFGQYRNLRSQGVGSIVKDSSQENLTISILSSLFASSSDFKSFFNDLLRNMTVSIGLGIVIAWLYVCIALICIMLLYKRRVFDARIGKVFVSSLERASILRAGQYMGLQLGSTVVAFVFMSFLVFLVVFLLLWDYTRTKILTFLVAAVIAYILGTLLFALFLAYVSRFIAKDGDIVRRRWFGPYDLALTVLGLVAGFLAALKQFALDVANLVFLTMRLDIARGDASRAFVNQGFSAYCSMFRVDMLFNNNPVFIAFCYIFCVPFIDSTKEIPKSTILSVKDMDEKISWDGMNDAEADQSFSSPILQHLEITSADPQTWFDLELLEREASETSADIRKVILECKRACRELIGAQRLPFTLNPQGRSQLARNKWFLALTLLRNPQLAELRKHALLKKRLLSSQRDCSLKISNLSFCTNANGRSKGVPAT
eukprot:ANDGO_05409.mRNA.1 hypothetical protein AMSG_07193